MTRPVTRGAQGGLKPPCKNCRPPWRNVLDVVWNYSTQSKNFGPSQKTLHHPWCPKLVTGLLMTSNTRSPGLVLGFEFKSTFLTAFDHPEKERLAACLLHDIDIAVVCFIWWNLLHLTENTVLEIAPRKYTTICVLVFMILWDTSVFVTKVCYLKFTISILWNRSQLAACFAAVRFKKWRVNCLVKRTGHCRGDWRRRTNSKLSFAK